MSAPLCLSADSSSVEEIYLRQCPCCPPANLPQNYNHDYLAGPHQEPHPGRQLFVIMISSYFQHWFISRILSTVVCVVTHSVVFLIVPFHRIHLQNRQPPKGAQSAPRHVAPHPDMLHEVSVGHSSPAGARSATREIRKTISLPEECSKSRRVPR